MSIVGVVVFILAVIVAIMILNELKIKDMNDKKYMGEERYNVYKADQHQRYAEVIYRTDENHRMIKNVRAMKKRIKHQSENERQDKFFKTVILLNILSRH